MTWAVTQRPKDAQQKLLLLVLANYAGQDNTCWPSKQRLADDCSMSKATVCRTLLKLAAAGLVRVEERHRPDGTQTSSIVQLVTVSHRDSDCLTQRQWVSHTETGTVSHRDTNLSLEPVIEPRVEAPLAGRLSTAQDLPSGASPPDRLITSPCAVAAQTGDVAKLQPAKKGSRLSKEWEPTDADWQSALLKLGAEAAREEFEKFCDHWHAKAGKDAVKLDWDATYRNWNRNAYNFRSRRTQYAK